MGLATSGGIDFARSASGSPVRLVATGQAYLESPVVRTEKIADDTAQLSAQTMITNVGSTLSGFVEAAIVDLTSGRIVWRDRAEQAIPAGISYWERSIRLERPNLWWPNGLGLQSLYRLDLSLHVPAHEMDTISTRFGIRTIETAAQSRSTRLPTGGKLGLALGRSAGHGNDAAGRRVISLSLRGQRPSLLRQGGMLAYLRRSPGAFAAAAAVDD